ncbi:MULTISPECIES: hypothetical protein [Streptomyces]|uniref:Uncharacterized protein n=1 Tax=Streptomyces tsukubensis (strain DSM 42081 / NBRC 108919 / NRRL 18488 / 9993) TaxID=1114943 RepID=I2N477_STRT9|nr:MULTISPECIES: hypothetical protein [Streptomyces]AZK95900.1 hypothetical protein B7R87_20065 [Streptomyces tsukubensis]EIF91824.1 hypothetical protein [Streptomyces tsukubensis NRRL18488]MYS67577.1 hypothetical protein [Streptomyces sp. SID5473]QKM68081.1 hypothetical protein STSU_013720 [Streptomyces tsukubensis NRRL18488]TAI44481.1 hypothetical protein EWI31_13515 [Streptomyces tsukubensis]
MPSEGKPQLIDTADIATPADVPSVDPWLLLERRERHTERLAEAPSATADVFAALALGTAVRRILDEQEQQLVREGLRRGATWGQLGAAIGVAGPEVRAAFMAWAERLPEAEAAEALSLASHGLVQ